MVDLAPLPTPKLLVVLSSPSGGGKTTVCDELLRRNSQLRRSVSMTTRPPRSGEKDGRDYHFVNSATFHDMMREERFLEWAEVHGNFYGTPREYVENVLREGHDVILNIDVQGGLHIKKAMPGSVLVFLRPPSMKELEDRLRRRGADDEETIRKRLLNAEFELQRVPDYDYVVENRDLEEAVARVQAILWAEKSRLSRISGAPAGEKRP